MDGPDGQSQGRELLPSHGVACYMQISLSSPRKPEVYHGQRHQMGVFQVLTMLGNRLVISCDCDVAYRSPGVFLT